MADNKESKPAKIWHADDKRIKLQTSAENPTGTWQPVPKTRKPNK